MPTPVGGAKSNQCSVYHPAPESSLEGGRIVIVRAETLVHARLLAAADEVARAYLFDDGFLVDPEFEQMIPDDLIGRTLSREEAIGWRKARKTEYFAISTRSTTVGGGHRGGATRIDT